MSEDMYFQFSMNEIYELKAALEKLNDALGDGTSIIVNVADNGANGGVITSEKSYEEIFGENVKEAEEDLKSMESLVKNQISLLDSWIAAAIKIGIESDNEYFYMDQYKYKQQLNVIRNLVSADKLKVITEFSQEYEGFREKVFDDFNDKYFWNEIGDYGGELDDKKEVDRCMKLVDDYRENIQHSMDHTRLKEKITDCMETIKKVGALDEFGEVVKAITGKFTHTYNNKATNVGDIIFSSFSIKGGELLQNFEATKDVLKANYDIDINEQHPYHVILSPGVIEDIWTIGPGITSDESEQDLYDRVNDALGLEGSDRKNPPYVPGDESTYFTEQELYAAMSVIMTEEYLPAVISDIDQFNIDYEKVYGAYIPHLPQHQLDALCIFYWQCGTGAPNYYDDFYFVICDVLKLIGQGNNEQACSQLTEIFMVYDVGSPRSQELAELFVYGDYTIKGNE